MASLDLGINRDLPRAWSWISLWGTLGSGADNTVPSVESCFRTVTCSSTSQEGLLLRLTSVSCCRIALGWRELFCPGYSSPQVQPASSNGLIWGNRLSPLHQFRQLWWTVQTPETPVRPAEAPAEPTSLFNPLSQACILLSLTSVVSKSTPPRNFLQEWLPSRACKNG